MRGIPCSIPSIYEFSAWKESGEEGIWKEIGGILKEIGGILKEIGGIIRIIQMCLHFVFV